MTAFLTAALLTIPLVVLAGPLGQWRAAAPMPTKRTEVTAAELDGKIYVIGGFGYFFLGGVSDAVEAYDPKTDQWEKRASLVQSLHHTAVAAVNGKLYLVGGYRRIWPWRAVNTVWEYDPAEDRWRRKAPMPTARGALAIGVIDGKIYATLRSPNPTTPG
jgi:N-acetylneuraminic acid mutarotase